MNIKGLILSILLFCGGFSFSQPPLDWVSAATIGGGFQDYVEDVFVDAAGNTYACGTFRGSLTFGSDNLFASAAGQVFVVKYNSVGVAQWAIQSNGNSQAFAKSIFVDALGYVYVGGYHSHAVLSFAGLSLPSSSNEGFYILKITPTGLPSRLTGPTFFSTGKSQAWGIDGDGDYIYVTGSHKAALTLPGGPSLPATVGQSDVFVARVDSSLTTFDYAFSHGSTENDQGKSIALNGAEFFVTGSYGNAPCTFISTGPDYTLPAYGQEAMFLTSFDNTTGDVLWSTSAGTNNGPSRGNDIMFAGASVFVTGACSDTFSLVDTPVPAGPFVYNDTIFSNGGLDAFVARYSGAGVIQNFWNEGGLGNDEAFGITSVLACTEVEICGSFEDSINFGGTTPLIANGKDMFISAYSPAGVYQWASKEISTGDEIAYSIHSNGNITSVGGEISANTFFGTSPLTQIVWNGFNDHFVSSFECINPPPCGPTITTCVQDDTVISDPSCSYVLTDYTTGLTVVDGCATGITLSQFPPPLNILTAGINEIILTATDGGTNTDVCIFNLFIEADSGPILASCGDKFTTQSSGGSGNDFNSFSCSSINTPGQDIIYQITVEAGNQFLQVKMDNAVDANDPFAYVYWLADNCPNTGLCSEVDSFNITTNKFSNNSQYLTFLANGPGTYYLVIDAKTDSIQNFDIEFFCSSGGIEFDNTSCAVVDTDSDGIVAYTNGSAVDLTLQPCESVTICHDLYIANVNDWEWLDSVSMQLGDCYENINVLTLTPNSPPNDNGFYDSFGEWVATYNAGTNDILWEFSHSSSNPWGDGNTGQYNCQLYTFCFDADITSTCATSDGLNIGIAIGDDGGKGEGPPSTLFDIGNSNDFILQDDNPFFTYSTAVLCDADPSIIPDSITTAGGSFTASAGILFTDGSPSPTGDIDLMTSTIGGPYTITYTVGLCPFTQDFNVDIFAQEVPAFTYPFAAYCQGDSDPVATVTGTSGGLFTAPAGIVFIDNLTGEIDLSASTSGGPFWITYTTPGPNCINADSVQLTINPEDDPSFNYAVINHCAADANVLPTSISAPGGTFSELSTNVTIIAGTGEVNIVGSLIGNYYIVYVTSGICPNTDSVQFNILPEDDPSFNYTSAAYCQGLPNPIANITGTAGGVFSSFAPITFASTATGEIDLSASTAGGPYFITYTTIGPACPNSDSVQVTINPEDDSTFSYISNALCLADPNPFPSISGTPGGTFTTTAGLIFTDGSPSPTGEIDITGSTVGGPYTITYTTPGPACPNTMDFVISIYNEDDPSLFYNPFTFCQNEPNPVPTITTPGGSFTGPVIFADNVTGEIDLVASTPGGPFQVIYTSPGPECPNTDTAWITITALDNPNFSYIDSLFCDLDLTASATITGLNGGVFSTPDTSLLSLNVISGQIDLLNSTNGGPYNIQYATNGTCPDSSTVFITIFAPPTADAGADQSLFSIDSTNLAAVNPAVGIGTWSIVNGSGNLADALDSSSLITNLASGVTTLQWTVTNGACPSASDEMIITLTNLLIPQALTPNNDGLNDNFEIDGIQLLEHQIDIFNRWGQVIFSSSDYQNDWSGTNENGDELVNDTYFYIITVDGTKFKGFIVLKR
jgi:gliding motility-associated-like protein